MLGFTRLAAERLLMVRLPSHGWRGNPGYGEVRYRACPHLVPVGVSIWERQRLAFENSDS